MRECSIFQRHKNDQAASLGLLEPLPIPGHIWKVSSMDFVEGLPKSIGKMVILVIVDTLSKYAHFITLSHPYTALDVAQAFLDSLFKLHGLPTSITSNRAQFFIVNEV